MAQLWNRRYAKWFWRTFDFFMAQHNSIFIQVFASEQKTEEAHASPRAQGLLKMAMLQSKKVKTTIESNEEPVKKKSRKCNRVPGCKNPVVKKTKQCAGPCHL